MPCNHKFQQCLDLQTLDFEPTTLIVGTFQPAWPDSNPAQWFYGRTAASCFWNVLPRLYGEHSLINETPDEWKAFCKRHRIALTDLVSCIDDADVDNGEHHKIIASYADPALVFHFDDFEFTDVVRLLKQHPIKNVYLTRGITEAFWKHLWGPVVRFANQNDLHERTLLNPSAEASYHHSAYNTHHPDAPVAALEDYILMRWRDAWHF